ncbi:MAG: flavodoxin [Lachnospiraceae bacterium]|nr:flavodoxin [Lachnospiraceae bacterium]
MSKGIILYQSKYGATKKYADWLKEATGFDCIETKKADIQTVRNYDTILLGGGVYASGIAGLSFLRKHIATLKDKKIAVFCVGASPYDKTSFEAGYRHNFKDALEGITCFYCRGAWNEAAMSFSDRTLCKLLQKAVAKKNPADYEPWEQALVSAMGQSCDWTEKKYLEPLLNYIKE